MLFKIRLLKTEQSIIILVIAVTVHIQNRHIQIERPLQINLGQLPQFVIIQAVQIILLLRVTQIVAQNIQVDACHVSAILTKIRCFAFPV